MVLNPGTVQRIGKEIKRELFKAATPSCDYDKLCKSPEVHKKHFYKKYYLEKEPRDQIIDEVCQRHDLSVQDTDLMRQSVTMSCCPRCEDPSPDQPAPPREKRFTGMK